MTLTIRPADPDRPDFVGEVSRHRSRAPARPAEVAAIDAGHGPLRRAGVPRPAHRRRAAARLQPQFRPARTGDRRHRPGRRSARLAMEVNDISNLDRDDQVLARDDRKRLFSLGNMLWHSDSSFKPTPAKYSLLSARIIPGRAATPSSPTCAPPGTRSTRRPRRWCATWSASTARSIRAACSASPTSPRRSGRAGTPVPQRLVRRHPRHRPALAVPRRRMPARSAAGRCRRRARCLRDLTEHATQRRVRPRPCLAAGDLVMWDNRVHHAPRPPLRSDTGARPAPHHGRGRGTDAAAGGLRRERMAAIVQALSSSDAEAEEWRLRADMAAVFRVSARLGWNEQIGNHNSLMLPRARPDDPPHFLINPRGYLFQELTASSLIVCDLEGRVLRGNGELRKVAFHIHVPHPPAKPDAACVLHVHPQYLTALSMLEEPAFALAHGNNLSSTTAWRSTTAAPGGARRRRGQPHRRPARRRDDPGDGRPRRDHVGPRWTRRSTSCYAAERTGMYQMTAMAHRPETAAIARASAPPRPPPARDACGTRGCSSTRGGGCLDREEPDYAR